MEPGVLKPIRAQDYLWIFTYEVFGVMLLNFGVMLSNGDVYVVAASIFMASMYSGRFTGAQYNPAITIGIYLLEGKWK